MPKYNELTTISGVLTIIAFSFLVYRVHITKITDHLTYLWIFLILIAQSLLIIYGRINHIIGLYFPALIIFSGVLYIFYIKTIYNETYFLMQELKSKDILKDEVK
jgi:hypothetical protein